MTFDNFKEFGCGNCNCKFGQFFYRMIKVLAAKMFVASVWLGDLRATFHVRTCCCSTRGIFASEVEVATRALKSFLTRAFQDAILQLGRAQGREVFSS